MAKDYSRTQRIGDQMQRELAVLIQREIKDPRLGLVTITAVDVSRDLSHAKVFITVMGKDDDAEQIKLNLEILGEAAGYLRMLLGKSMKVRTIPQLHFHYDASIRRGAELSALMQRVNIHNQNLAVAAAKDRNPAALAEAATFSALSRFLVAGGLVLLALAVLGAVAVLGPRELLRRPRLWIGAGIALVIAGVLMVELGSHHTPDTDEQQAGAA